MSNDGIPMERLGSAENVWRGMFDALADFHGQDDAIDLAKLKDYLKSESSLELEMKTGCSRRRLLFLASRLQATADANGDGKISLDEWEQWVVRDGRTFLHKYPKLNAVVAVVAYSPHYSCSPPTVFILTISLLQMLFYLFCLYVPDWMWVRHPYHHPGWLLCTYFISHPHRRREAWRFLTYIFLHANHQHIIFNMILQLVVGIPLEMSQYGWIGKLRVAGLYFSGVLLGSLAASVVQPNHYIVGASAGVYSLVAAHLATLILNWHEDGLVYQNRLQMCKSSSSYRPAISLNPLIRGLRLAFIVLFSLLDIGQAVYTVYALGETTNTSYVGHAFGALSGLLIGVFVLQNRKVENWEVIFKWVSFTLYGIMLSVFLLWHLIGSFAAWFEHEEWQPDPICVKLRGNDPLSGA